MSFGSNCFLCSYFRNNRGRLLQYIRCFLHHVLCQILCWDNHLTVGFCIVGQQIGGICQCAGYSLSYKLLDSLGGHIVSFMGNQLKKFIFSLHFFRYLWLPFFHNLGEMLQIYASFLQHISQYCQTAGWRVLPHVLQHLWFSGWICPFSEDRNGVWNLSAIKWEEE